ncbi:hypothetical protein PR202_gb17319 [Eleusine coracana subsp. coracana]|uniref:Non-haem dioxygenase N-terminal domain-containing protein n=1 Tax=Eleusine coracana subsp. coracana TaxID=191504 RepID=A0AAV5F3Z0_ELECO|nr:hypothetical protein PR202_gb17319 [Eleusine coracana subsp. coracana]
MTEIHCLQVPAPVVSVSTQNSLPLPATPRARFGCDGAAPAVFQFPISCCRLRLTPLSIAVDGQAGRKRRWREDNKSASELRIVPQLHPSFPSRLQLPPRHATPNCSAHGVPHSSGGRGVPITANSPARPRRAPQGLRRVPRRRRRGIVESAASPVPELFVHSSDPYASAPLAPPGVSMPVVDLSLPAPLAAAAATDAARRWGFFHLVNHHAALGVPADHPARALAAVRAFNELPAAERAAHYSRAGAADDGTGVSYYSNVDLFHSPAASWRDTIDIAFGTGAQRADPAHIPAVCRDELLEWDAHVTAVGRVVLGLLCEGLGLGPVAVEELSCIPFYMSNVPSAGPSGQCTHNSRLEPSAIGPFSSLGDAARRPLRGDDGAAPAVFQIPRHVLSFRDRRKPLAIAVERVLNCVVGCAGRTKRTVATG